MLTPHRAMGLTRPGGLAAGLARTSPSGSGCAAEPEPDEPNGTAAGISCTTAVAHTWIASPHHRCAPPLSGHRTPGRSPRRDLRSGFDCLTATTRTSTCLIYETTSPNRTAAALYRISERSTAHGRHRPAATSRTRYPHTPVRGAPNVAHRSGPPGRTPRSPGSPSRSHPRTGSDIRLAANRRRQEYVQEAKSCSTPTAQLTPTPRRRRCPV